VKLTRRETIVMAATASLAGAAGWSPAFAAEGDMIDLTLLMAPDGLPDKVLGNADAKVTFIEYASPTCPHCAAFSNDILPAFLEKYVDTGKVKFILRPFARNNIDAAIFLLAEAAAIATDASATTPADPTAVSSMEPAPAPVATFSLAAIEAYHNVISTYFRTQTTWTQNPDTYTALLTIGQQLGFSKETFDAALADEARFVPIQSMRDQALKVFKLEGTPAFYLNGKQLTGSKTMEQLSAEIDPLLL
jgi:protein-disulfide isomerase